LPSPNRIKMIFCVFVLIKKINFCFCVLEWKCNFCKKDRTFKGSYTRVKAHILHEGKGIEGCSHTLDLQVRDRFQKEHDDAKKVEDNRAKIAMHGSSKHPPSLGVSNEPRIVHEARKRRALEVENEISKGPGGRGTTSDNILIKMFNNQKREETKSRVARAIFACGIPFNVVRSPYWKDMVKAINDAPQGFKGPNYEKLRTMLLQKERSLIHDILKPVRSSWTNSWVSIISDGWTDTMRRPLINVIASSPKGAMFLRAEDCFGEVKDNKFIADILIFAIEQVGPTNVVQVITHNVPVCKAAGLIVESRYNHNFWTPCIVHNLNLILEEIEAKTEWIKELTGQASEIIKFITNHHQS
jgi:hypothetical protein